MKGKRPPTGGRPASSTGLETSRRPAQTAKPPGSVALTKRDPSACLCDGAQTAGADATYTRQSSISAVSMNDDALFMAMRQRAYELAETGRYRHWDKVATVLHAEGFVDSLIRRLECDGLAVMMITRCCDQARERSSWLA